MDINSQEGREVYEKTIKILNEQQAYRNEVELKNALNALEKTQNTQPSENMKNIVFQFTEKSIVEATYLLQQAWSALLNVQSSSNDQIKYAPIKLFIEMSRQAEYEYKTFGKAYKVPADAFSLYENAKSKLVTTSRPSFDQEGRS